MFDGAIEEIERLSGALAQELVEQEGEPGREHLLGHTLGPAQQQLGMTLALHALVDELAQQRLENISAVLHLALQGDHDERGDVDAIAHVKVAIGLERADEEEEEGLVHEQLAEEAQRFLLALQFGALPLQQRVLFHAGEEDLHGVGAVVEERDPARRQVRRQVRHLRLQFGERFFALGRHLIFNAFFINYLHFFTLFLLHLLIYSFIIH